MCSNGKLFLKKVDDKLKFAVLESQQENSGNKGNSNIKGFTEKESKCSKAKRNETSQILVRP